MKITTLLSAALLACASGAMAAPATTWLNVGGISLHPGDRNGTLNGYNPGIGIEYHRPNGDFIAAGYYHNSVRKGSRYAVYAWQLAAKDGVSLGVFSGVVDGYPSVNNGNIMPFSAPYLSIMGERFGVNLVFIPSIEKRVSSALAVQFKIKIN